jgi:hypothetical protein
LGNAELFEAVLNEGERKQVAIAVMEQDGKSRLTPFPFRFGADDIRGTGGMAIALDVPSGDDKVGSVLVELHNNKGTIRATSVSGQHASVKEGEVTCFGVGPHYAIHLLADDYAGKTLRSVEFK